MMGFKEFRFVMSVFSRFQSWQFLRTAYSEIIVLAMMILIVNDQNSPCPAKRFTFFRTYSLILTKRASEKSVIRSFSYA
jgi:hypothetical protein